MIQRDENDKPRSTRTVPPRQTAVSPPTGGGGGGQPGGSSNPGTPGTPGQGGMGPTGNNLTTAGGPMHGSGQAVEQQSQRSGLVGQTPFWQTPGVQVGAAKGYDPGQQFASQRVTGETIANDPWVSASLQNFAQNVAPQIQNRATLMGLGRSSTAANAMSNAQMQALLPLYQQAAGLEENRINRMTQQGQFEAGLAEQQLGRLGGSVENELGRQERSAERASNANQNMIQNLFGLSDRMYGRQQQTGQSLLNAGGQYRDIAQQGNSAAYQDFLRRQALGEQAVYTPFGGLAQGGLGSTTSSSGK